MSGSVASKRLFNTFIRFIRRNNKRTLPDLTLSEKEFVSASFSNFFRHFNKSKNVFVPLFGTGLLYGVFSLKHAFTVEAADIKDGVKSRTQQFNFIADIVEKAAPSVVCIENKIRHAYGRGNIITESNGSGFIVREDGLILTNAHVVANKELVIIKLQDGRQFTGKVQAVDQITDLATVKINANNLPALKLGKSSNVRAGEWVIAMGSPLSLSNTVTCGIVSSVQRQSKELGLHQRDVDYIQTDAVINFGNSGGPLVNLDGEVIGINTMKVTTGISFAIPSDIAGDFLDRAGKLMKRQESRGHLESKKRRYMGIAMLTLTPSLIADFQQRIPEFPADLQSGVLVSRINLGSPAYLAGLEPGDVITQINGNEVKTSADVFNAIESGEVLRVKIVRRNRSYLFDIVPEDVN